MNRYLVTIIIPVYNRELFIEECLNSIQDQTYQNWETIIIDDGSTDNTPNIIENYCRNDKRFKLLYRNLDPKGAATCRNIGIQESSGDYIIFLDSDDLIAPSCLEDRVNYMRRNPNLHMGIFPGLRFYKNVNDSNILISSYKEQNALQLFLTFDAPWVIHNPIWDKDFISDHSLYFDTHLKSYQDLDYHVRALLNEANYDFAEYEPDCFWRINTHSSIGIELSQNKNLNSIIYLYKKLIVASRKNKLFNGVIKASFYNRVIQLIEIFPKNIQSYKDSIKILNEFNDINLFGKYKLLVLKYHLKFYLHAHKHKLPLIRGLSYYLLRKTFHRSFSTNFLNYHCTQKYNKVEN